MPKSLLCQLPCKILHHTTLDKVSRTIFRIALVPISNSQQNTEELKRVLKTFLNLFWAGNLVRVQYALISNKGQSYDRSVFEETKTFRIMQKIRELL